MSIGPTSSRAPRSPITPARVAKAMAGVAEPRLFENNLYWLENRPSEGGRVTLLKAENGARTELTPQPYNVRNRVHESGGASYLPARDQVFFVNAADQDVYRITVGGAIRQVTASGVRVRYADLCLDERRGRLLAVTEIHQEGGHPMNALAAISIETGSATIVHQGYDFYAAPRVSPNGGELLFVAWDHPNMPWDETLLLRATLDGAGIGTPTLVAGGANESVLQPNWLAEGVALYLSDATGFWNLHRADTQGTAVILQEQAEYADPPWQFGGRDYAVLNERYVAARRQSQGEQTLVLIDLETRQVRPLPDDCIGYSQLSADRNTIYFVGFHAKSTSELAKYDIRTQRRTTLVAGPSLDFDGNWLSHPRHITYNTRDGSSAHAWLYLPAERAAPPPGDKPPLLVTTHGGPTSNASSALRLVLQFYCSRGWAVADINYRGSSGYGRRYRNALKGRWGLLDVTDCVDAVDHLIGAGLIDPQRVAIRGGSAGGYTTLRAVTTQTAFRAAASHYGIGDLCGLANDTHKFESRYIDELVGAGEILIERSPIHHLDGFNCPTIFFQGGEDKIVPPNQARAMVAALDRRGIPVAYFEYPGEGHGFRDGINIANTIGAEYAFLCRVFGIPTNEDLPDVNIRNLPNEAGAVSS